MAVGPGCMVRLKWINENRVVTRSVDRVVIFTLTDIPSPVSNWQPDMVQTRSSDIREI